MVTWEEREAGRVDVQVRNHGAGWEGGGNHPGVPFLGNLGSEPPPHLQGAGAASSIWHVLSRWGRILPAWGGAPLPAPPAPLPMNWRGLRSRRTEEGQADAMTMEKAPLPLVWRSQEIQLFF